MIRTPDQVIQDIRTGKRLPVYLLHGDELLTRQGAQKIVNALVPPDQQMFGVEVLSEGPNAPSVPMRLRTVPLLGGVKVVVVHDTKAFASKQGAGQYFRKSFEAWKDEDASRAARLFMQGLGAAGQDRACLERAARGALDESAWRDLLGMAPEPETEAWLQAVAVQALTDGAEIPSGMAGTAQVYEDLLAAGVPAGAVLIMTAEVVDQRRALFKRIDAVGAVLDCSVRTGKAGETQMRPELVRAAIRDRLKAAKKQIDADAVDWIVERTGFSMRALASELDKVVLFVGERPRIQVGDVAAVLSNARESGVFDLTNAIDDRDARRAMGALRGLLAQREAEQAILGLIAAELRQLIIARCAIDGRLGGSFDPGLSYPAFQSRVLPKLSADAPKDGSAAKLSAMHPFRAYNLLRSGARYNVEELVQALRTMHALDLAGKAGGSLDAVALEGLILSLCHA